MAEFHELEAKLGVCSAKLPIFCTKWTYRKTDGRTDRLIPVHPHTFVLQVYKKDITSQVTYFLSQQCFQRPFVKGLLNDSK